MRSRRLPGIVAMTFDHRHLAERRHADEHLLARLDAGGLQLVEDVAPRLDDGRRAGRTRAEGHLLAQVLPGLVAVEVDGATGFAGRCDGCRWSVRLAVARRCGRFGCRCGSRPIVGASAGDQSHRRTVDSARSTHAQRRTDIEESSHRPVRRLRTDIVRALAPTILASPAARSPAAWRRCRPASAARSSARGRAASLPTARPSPTSAESQTAPGTSSPGSPSPDR